MFIVTLFQGWIWIRIMSMRIPNTANNIFRSVDPIRLILKGQRHEIKVEMRPWSNGSRSGLN
jgi:hypothetical protein